MKEILKHLKLAHKEVEKGNVKRGQFHIGHALAATRQAIKNPQGMGMSDPSQMSSPSPDPMQEANPMAGKNWIAGAIKNPGALHQELGIPQGENIPAKKINAAANSDNPTLARRATLAKTLKKMHGSKK
jgi:hypothetical protein